MEEDYNQWMVARIGKNGNSKTIAITKLANLKGLNAGDTVLYQIKKIEKNNE